MVAFCAITLVTIVMTCGMFKKRATKASDQGKTNAGKKTKKPEVRVIYNPKSGALELGTKASDPDDRMTELDNVLSGIINQNFMERNQDSSAKLGADGQVAGRDCLKCISATVTTDAGPCSQDHSDKTIQKTNASGSHAYNNLAFQ